MPDGATQTFQVYYVPAPGVNGAATTPRRMLVAYRRVVVAPDADAPQGSGSIWTENQHPRMWTRTP